LTCPSAAVGRSHARPFVDAGRQVAELGLFSSMMGAGGLLGIAIHASVGARISAQNWLAVAFCGSAVGSLLLSQLPGVPVLMLLGALVWPRSSDCRSS
ncbi:hypothetical protein AAIH44_35800, partial [Pseudomonas aeruginosa]